MKSNADDIERAMGLLKAAVTLSGSKTAVAKRIGVSRPLLARVMSENDPVSMSAKLACKVLAFFDKVACPETGQRVTEAHCKERAALPLPTHNPQTLRLWKACRACPNHPVIGDKPCQNKQP